MRSPNTDSYHSAIITHLSSGLEPQDLTQPVVHPLQELPTFELLFHAENTSPSSPATIFLANLSSRACTCPLHVSSSQNELQ